MTKITFPNKTAKEIIDECDNKLNGHKFLYNISWYKDEDFFTKEKCRQGTREVITDLTDTLGKTWNECKEMGEMLNFAELLWVVNTVPDFIQNNYSWTSSRNSNGCFVYAGDFDGGGGVVNGRRPGDSRLNVGCAFSTVKIGESSIDTLNHDSPSRAGVLEDLQARVIELERKIKNARIDFSQIK